MTRFRRFLWIVVALLAGCASHEPLPRYFVLTSDASATGTRSGTQGGIHGARIFIRRVDIPGYLKTTKLASRRADNQIEYSTAPQWAEPLNEGIADAVANAIDRTSRATVVGVIGGGIPPAREYDLKIDVERFEGDDRGDVVLLATWSLFAPESSTPVLTRRSRFVQSGWKYGDYAGLAKLLGVDVTQLGAEIARSIRS
jgi:uncharacterized lipoprotein YmbA